jgi:GNAT superfamily N-acetyltransferase
VTDLEVRPASIDDAPGAEPLLDDALERLRALRGGPALLERLGVPAAIDAPALALALCGDALGGTATLVAVLDGAIAGIAVVVRSAGGVDLLGVHTARALRRRRIGTSLLEAARTLASTSSDRFEALALPGDQTVKSLLEAAGFRARLLRMSDDR